MIDTYGNWPEESNKIMREQEWKALELIRERKGAGDQDPPAQNPAALQPGAGRGEEVKPLPRPAN